MTYGLDTSVMVRILTNDPAALSTPRAWKSNPGFIDRVLASEYVAKGFVPLSCEKSFRRLDLAEVIG